MSAIPNLDEKCRHDGRPIGEHTLREWSEHFDLEEHHLPYEAVPGGLTLEYHGDELPIADNVDARASVMAAQAGQADVRLPCLILDFAVSALAGPPRYVSRVAVVAPTETMRKIGQLLRDSANGAANAAERAGGFPT